MEYGKYSNDLYELQVICLWKTTPSFCINLHLKIMKCFKIKSLMYSVNLNIVHIKPEFSRYVSFILNK